VNLVHYIILHHFVCDKEFYVVLSPPHFSLHQILAAPLLTLWLVGWSLTSLFSTNTAISEAKVWLMISEGWLSHAILDVFEKEPLPEDSELWTHPHVTVTPHVAAYETNYRKVRRRLVITNFVRH